MKIFKAVSSVDVPNDGFILDDGNKVAYLSREGVVSKDFEDVRGEQVFPPLKSVEPVDPRAVRWGERMLGLIADEYLKNDFTELDLREIENVANAVRAVCEREYVPQPEDELIANNLDEFQAAFGAGEFNYGDFVISATGARYRVRNAVFVNAECRLCDPEDKFDCVERSIADIEFPVKKVPAL